MVLIPQVITNCKRTKWNNERHVNQEVSSGSVGSTFWLNDEFQSKNCDTYIQVVCSSISRNSSTFFGLLMTVSSPNQPRFTVVIIWSRDNKKGSSNGGRMFISTSVSLEGSMFACFCGYKRLSKNTLTTWCPWISPDLHRFWKSFVACWCNLQFRLWHFSLTRLAS